MFSVLIDLTGKRFGDLVVIRRAPDVLRKKRKDGAGIRAAWLCRCDCGREKVILGEVLRRGDATGCGCGRKRSHLRHGATSKTIPGAKTAEYAAWSCAKQRCTNPKDKGYRRYGARGIYMAPEWADSFDAFLRDMGCRPTAQHSIDRIDNDGPYAPWNCRWATRIEQARNKSPRHRRSRSSSTELTAPLGEAPA